MSSVLSVQFPPWPLLPGQQAFAGCLVPEAAYIGGVGAGKSVALVTRAVLLAHQFPGNRVLISRKTYRSLNETTRTTFYEIVPPALIASENKSEDETYINCVGGGRSTIIWRSFEDSPSDWQKFRSAEYGEIFIDEASEAAAGLVDILITRLRAKVPYRSINFVSNPTPKEHWLYKRFLGPGVDRSHRQLFRGTTYENRENLPPGYIEELERSYADRPEMVDIILKGEFGHIPAGLPVFTAFRRTHEGKPWHVREGLQPVERVPILRGWDFGQVRPAIVWCQFTAVKRVLREKLGFNTSTRDFGRHIKELSTEMFPGFSFHDFCDPQGFALQPAEGKSDVSVLNELGIHPVHVKKTNPGFRAGLIEESLKGTVVTDTGMEPGFQVDSECSILIGALAGGYRRPEVIPDVEVDDEPVKDGYFEHPIDGLGFIFVGRTTMGGTRREGSDRRRARQRERARSYG